MKYNEIASPVARCTAILLAVLLVAGLLWPLTGEAAADFRIIVKLVGQGDTGSDAAVEEAVSELAARTGSPLRVIRAVGRDALLLAAPGISTVAERDELLQRLRSDPRVEYASADRRARVQFVPNDPFYVDQWNLYEDAGGIRMQAAWDVERGSNGIVTAIIDTGIVPHADLDAARLLPGYDFVSDVINDNDGTPGRDADPRDPGDATLANECEDGNSSTNSTWHGTSITGIVAATTDNLQGITGIDHKGRVLVIRALGKCGGFTSDIVDAMRWAAGLRVVGVPLNATPARVINLSVGSIDACSAFEQSAINEVVARGATIVVAAGNNGSLVASTSPANCNNVIAVAAMTRSGARTDYTNIGNRVDLGAPGGTAADPIPVLYNTGLTFPADDAIAYAAGTSFAATQVTGVVALMLANNPDLSPSQVENILKSAARPFPDASCDTTLCGAGILNAANAVTLAGQTVPEPPAVITPVESSAGGGGGGGGGCTVAAVANPDPLLPLLFGWAVMALCKRRHHRWRQGSVSAID